MKGRGEKALIIYAKAVGVNDEVAGSQGLREPGKTGMTGDNRGRAVMGRILLGDPSIVLLETEVLGVPRAGLDTLRNNGRNGDNSMGSSIGSAKAIAVARVGGGKETFRPWEGSVGKGVWTQQDRDRSGTQPERE